MALGFAKISSCGIGNANLKLPAGKFCHVALDTSLALRLTPKPFRFKSKNRKPSKHNSLNRSFKISATAISLVLNVTGTYPAMRAALKMLMSEEAPTRSLFLLLTLPYLNTFLQCG